MMENRSMFEQVNLSRRCFLGAAAMTITAAPFGTIASAKTRSELSPLARATAWLNSPPLTEADLKGRVVLVEFWTYSCINWRRQLPYVRAWAQKYLDRGLIVVGVHSPEFSFEKNIDNIRWAVKDMRVAFPVAVDNDHAVWRGFNNEYWPALYFADGKGNVRHHVFGEGEYEQSEKVIQKLLAEAGVGGSGKELVSVNASGPETAADWNELKSGENYLGYTRTEHFAATASPDKPRVYSVPRHLGLNSWAPFRRLDHGSGGAAVESAAWPHRLPLSRSRSSSRNGTGSGGDPRAISRAPGWTPAGECARG